MICTPCQLPIQLPAPEAQFIPDPSFWEILYGHIHGYVYDLLWGIP